MESTPPNPALPKVWCDFNAAGWSGEPDDHCYYAFDQEALAALGPREGLRFFAFMDDVSDEVVGCEAVLERFGRSWASSP